MPSSLLSRVQAHPSRKHLLPDLLAALEPLYVEVSTHESVPPDPWAGYRQALSNLPDCSHVLVIQDDALPVPNFAQAVEQIAERQPDTPVCLFMGAYPASTAAAIRRAKMRDRYQPLLPSSFVPLVACLWPRPVAERFLHWGRGRKLSRADDGNASKWMRATRQPFLVAVPSIVEHNDFVPSVKGGREHVPGAESWRSALFLAEDAAAYEW
jgi:hypothetical protein